MNTPFNAVNKNGTLKCAIKKSPAGHVYKKVCGRNCILFNNKVWNFCKHKKI